MFEYSFTYTDLEYFLLIFVRITCYIYTAPFFSLSNVPRRYKAGLGFFLTMILYSVLMPHDVPSYNTVYGYAALVLKEGITGLLIGLGANLCNSIVLFAGKVADVEVGLSMVQLFDPTSNQSSGFTGTLYQYALTLIMIVSGMHRFFLNALVETFRLIPIGGAKFNSDAVIATVTGFLRQYMAISLKLCLPILMAIMITNAVLGILVKVSPQIHMFSVGIQIKLLVGLGIIFITIGILPDVSEYIFTEMKVMMTNMVQSMT